MPRLLEHLLYPHDRDDAPLSLAHQLGCLPSNPPKLGRSTSGEFLRDQLVNPALQDQGNGGISLCRRAIAELLELAGSDLEDPASADPADAERNRARGWSEHLVHRPDDGEPQALSYRVIDSLDDVRAAMRPRRQDTDGIVSGATREQAS